MFATLMFYKTNDLEYWSANVVLNANTLTEADRQLDAFAAGLYVLPNFGKLHLKSLHRHVPNNAEWTPLDSNFFTRNPELHSWLRRE